MESETRKPKTRNDMKQPLNEHSPPQQQPPSGETNKLENEPLDIKHNLKINSAVWTWFANNKQRNQNKNRIKRIEKTIVSNKPSMINSDGRPRVNFINH